MTHLLDTSALLAHYLAEPGAEQVQALFENEAVEVGVSILSLYEFEFRLHRLGVPEADRIIELNRYRTLLNEIQDVNESVRREAIRLRVNATAHIAAMDVLIAASASLNKAALVHRDPHFNAVPSNLLKQEVLPAK